MKFHFIRHGETAYNRSGIHQGPDVPLSDTGQEQAKKVAERLKEETSVTKIIASDFLRTQQTAKVIQSELEVSLDASELLREVRRPSELVGKKHFGIDTARIGLGILMNLGNPSWHYSDEESMSEVQARVDRTREFLANLSEGHDEVAVVSHAFYINIFFKYVCASTHVHMADYLRMLSSAKFLKNTSVSTLTYEDDEDPLTCDWVCERKNDYSHLN